MTARPSPASPPTLDELAALVALQLGLARVGPDARLLEDLGATSMDLVGVLAAIEDRWGAALDETVFAAVSTVAELHAAVLTAPPPS